jgi:ABC-type cobalamin/Fe3+-siderophores transport system ATPase subunit
MIKPTVCDANAEQEAEQNKAQQSAVQQGKAEQSKAEVHRRMNRIVPAAARNTAPKGAKTLLIGPTGVGKTSLLRTLDPATTLFVDIEAGDLAVQDIAIDTFRPRTWLECRDLAVYLAGANPAVPTGAVYGEQHLDAVIDKFDAASKRLAQYRNFFIDSITAAGRLCFAWASQQPEAFSERSGKRDLRGAYGLHAREMSTWLLHLQQARPVNIVFIGILETVTDDFGRTEHRLQMEGSRTSRELPAIVDQIITLQWVDFGDGKLTRAFICTSPNPWQYPAKDRSGRLDQIEQPHLSKLIHKLTRFGGDLVKFPSAAE